MCVEVFGCLAYKMIYHLLPKLLIVENVKTLTIYNSDHFYV